MTEILRTRNQKELLAAYYHSIGNKELRDLYVEEVLKKDPTDYEIIHLRGIQDRPDLIPQEVINRQVALMTQHKDWTELARLYLQIRDYKNAAIYYVKGISRDLQDGNLHGAAYYLKEIVREGVISSLFELAYDKASAKKDLWWQVRALQELGWQTELKELLLQNKEKIDKSGNLRLKQQLALALGDNEQYYKLKKKEAESLTMYGPVVEFHNEDVER